MVWLCLGREIRWACVEWWEGEVSRLLQGWPLLSLGGQGGGLYVLRKATVFHFYCSSNGDTERKNPWDCQPRKENLGQRQEEDFLCLDSRTTFLFS